MPRRTLILFFYAMLSGCAVITPLVRDFNIVPVEQEKEIGEKMETQIASQMAVTENTPADQRVEAIGRRLVNALPQQNFRYEFHMVKNDSPNAFAIPGGSIYVHTGLLDFVQNDNELAGVLAHEIGHVYERHPAKAISRAYGFNYLAGLILPENNGKLQELALQFAQGGIMNKYGRDDEREADEIGFYLMKKAGYSPSGFLSFFQRLDRLSSGGNVPAFFRSHPPTAERIARLQSLINQSRETNPDADLL